MVLIEVIVQAVAYFCQSRENLPAPSGPRQLDQFIGGEKKAALYFILFWHSKGIDICELSAVIYKLLVLF